MKQNITLALDKQVLKKARAFAHNFDAGAKRQRAADCLRELWDAHAGRLKHGEVIAGVKIVNPLL